MKSLIREEEKDELKIRDV